MRQRFVWKPSEKAQEIAQEIVQRFLGQTHIALFHGEMGTGKTTLIKAICQVLGVKEVTNSPSFALLNEYTTVHRKTVRHFDLYRLNTIEELLDIGWEEYMEEDKICLVEWAEKVEDFLPDTWTEITLTLQKDHSRRVEVQLRGRRD